ncbi:hypothetical protein H5410_007447 [Solanum commersonii]|uniref:Uncharacterized protein n=1 Tax=Solanum commersonii TaxID=4109 RepID=A0A9J6AC52_SOLCO|nr:hypothetical protein H5410_007447 [Solanum commersonii]
MDDKEEKSSILKDHKVPFYKLFLFADRVDIALMTMGIFGAIGEGLTQPLMTLIFGQIINSFGGASSSNEVFHLVSEAAIYYVYLAIGSGIASFLRMSCWMVTGERQAIRIRGLYLKTILRQDIASFDTETTTGQVIGRMSGDTFLIQDALGDKVGKFIQYLSAFVGGFIIAFTKGWLLSLVLVSCIPALVIAGGAMASIMSKMSSRGQMTYAQAGDIVERTVGAMKTVAAFNGEKLAMIKYDNTLKIAYAFTVQQGLVSGVELGTFLLVLLSTYGLAIWYGSKLIIEKGYRGGDVINVLMAIMIGGMSLGQTTPSLNAFAAGQVAALEIFETISRKPLIDTSDMSGVVLEDIEGEIELKDVYFRYPARPDVQIFCGFSLVVPSGKTVALVGQSGSGKSTIISLLERFYDPEVGEILIDGVNLKKYQLKWLRQQMGLVNQEPILFATTIRENISYGKENATEEEISAAIELANAANFIDKRDMFINQALLFLTYAKTWNFIECSGALCARLSIDASTVRTVVGGLAIAFTANWILAFIILVVLPLICAPGLFQTKFHKGYTADAKVMYEEASQIANDAVGGIRTVASFCAEEKVLDMYQKKCEGPMKKGVKIGIVSGASLGFGSLTLYSSLGFCFFIGSVLIDHRLATVDQVFKVFFALILAAVGITQSTTMAPNFNKAKDSITSIFDILDRKSMIDSSSDVGTTLAVVHGDIEFRFVSYRYATRPDVQIFKDLCLIIPSGKTVALVGESGSGKSTVISLIERFYDPESGEIYLDGVEIKQFNLSWLWQQRGLGNATEEEITEAAKSANAHNFISSLPQGYDTSVGERGIQLSGGQKQRIAIARAILKDPKILLLDEATSALDSESERIVQEALDRVMVNRTTVVVAHRLTTIKGEDIIAVIKNGVIAEKGSHAVLMNIKDGAYASLVALHMTSA